MKQEVNSRRQSEKIFRAEKGQIKKRVKVC